MKRISPQPGVLRTAPYVPGERAITGIPTPHQTVLERVAARPEPAWHWPPIMRSNPELFRYPDAAQRALREAIAEVYGIEEARIVCGNGSDEVLSLLIRAYSGPGDEIILSQYSFAMCWTHARVHGTDVVVAPETDCRISVDAILACRHGAHPAGRDRQSQQSLRHLPAARSAAAVCTPGCRRNACW